MARLTLIGDRLAEVGMEFVYNGESSDCSGCPYRTQCLNLTPGIRYRIIGIRENASLLECAVHDSGVRAVEVEPAAVLANISDRHAFIGNKVTVPGDCTYTACPSHEYCVPIGNESEQEYRVSEIIGEPPHDYCMLDRDLSLVKLIPDTSSEN